MNTELLLTALRKALDQDPRNGPLWVHYGELLEHSGRAADALVALRTAAELPDVRRQASLALVRLLRRQGVLAEALVRAEAFLDTEDDPELRLELALILEARGEDAQAREQRDRVAALRPDLVQPPASPGAKSPPGPRPSPDREESKTEALAPVGPDPVDLNSWVNQFDWGDLRVTLDDVVGLAEVKRQVRLRIIAPFRQPEIFEAYGREGGGGLLLYGPPGCGKTFVARATAGELGARFVAVSIHEVVDKYWGESERLVHALFEDARRQRPTVLFFDEFDALGAKRSGDSQFWKTLVDQLLHEMDGLRGPNRDVLVLAATNLPWSVDPAFRRPGRFDRVLFVGPPDEEGRRHLLEKHARNLPGGDRLDLAKIARAAPLFTGADLRALCERAAEAPLEQSLNSGRVVPVTVKDFERALAGVSSSALEWLAQARNHARYANEGGHYDALIAFLKAVKMW